MIPGDSSAGSPGVILLQFAFLIFKPGDWGSGVKRILIIHGNRLLSLGVESLLAEVQGLVVKGIAYAASNRLASELNRFRPDMLIVDQSLLLADRPFVLDLIEEHPDLPIMTLDMHRNVLHIYQKSEITVSCKADLIAAILQEQPHDPADS